MGGMIAITILNALTLIVFVSGIAYLFIGAFINARREMKNKPKKKRTSMIVVVIAFMAFIACIAYFVNDNYYKNRPLYTLVYSFGTPRDTLMVDYGNNLETYDLEACKEKANKLNVDAEAEHYYCGKNCSESNSYSIERICKEVIE